MENTDETVNAIIREVCEVPGIPSITDEVDAVLSPLSSDVPHAYAHFTAEVP